MALVHLQPGEVGDIRPLGANLADAKTGALFKTEQLEVVRMVLPQGKIIAEHKAPGEIIVQCLEGRVAFTTMSKTVELAAGQLLYLATAEPHSLEAIENSAILLTIVLNSHGTAHA